MRFLLRLHRRLLSRCEWCGLRFSRDEQPSSVCYRWTLRGERGLFHRRCEGPLLDDLWRRTDGRAAMKEETDGRAG
jgi:hypothetical protein